MNSASSALPRDTAAECSVLGAILIRNELLDEVAALLDTEDFYSPAHRLLYEAMLELRISGTPIDAVTLPHAVGPAATAMRAELGPVGITKYIADSLQVPEAISAPHYARIVRQKATLRRLAEACQAYLAEASTVNGTGGLELLAATEQQMLEIFARAEQRPPPPFAELVERAAALMRSNDDDGTPTGFRDYDALTGGMHAGEMILLAAQTSYGKSSWALNVAVNMAKAGNAVLFLSLEMTGLQLAKRYLMSEAQISGAEARDRGIWDTELERVDDAVVRVKGLKLEVQFRPRLQPRVAAVLARQWKRRWGDAFKLLVVDYIGLMRPDSQERWSRHDLMLGDTAQAIKELAGDLGISALVCCQLNREITKRADPRPMLSDLRDSSILEQHSDTVCFIYGADKERAWALERDVFLDVAKNRNGVVGQIELLHYPRYTRFENRKSKAEEPPF